jgi:hypothetical protein
MVIVKILVFNFEYLSHFVIRISYLFNSIRLRYHISKYHQAYYFTKFYKRDFVSFGSITDLYSSFKS